MPGGDGTGPTGQGSGTGRGGGGQRQGRRGGQGLGPGGECVCPKCGTKAPHQQGVPCMNKQCPNCGNPMTRA